MTKEIDALLRESQRVMAEAIAAHSQGALFADFADRYAQARESRAVKPVIQPVVDRWLARAVDQAPEPWSVLADLLAAATPGLPWVRSYENLEATAELEEFRAFYSYQVFSGPVFRGHEPPLLIDNMLVGFSLQAPNIFYPAHHHEPPEMYGVISGRVEWQVGDTWSTVGPGDVIVHRSHESHAMRSLDEPVLTWVLWPCDPDTPVYMPSLDPPGNTMSPLSYS